MQVYISYITSQSYLQDAYSFSLGSLQDDPRMPVLQPLPDPAKFSSPYDYATAKNAVDKKNAALLSAWQMELKNNHEKLAAARAVLMQNTKKLRSLKNLKDPGLENVAGCLQSASERLQTPGVHGRKNLIFSSPPVRMVDTSAAGGKLPGGGNMVFLECYPSH